MKMCRMKSSSNPPWPPNGFSPAQRRSFSGASSHRRTGRTGEEAVMKTIHLEKALPSPAANTDARTQRVGRKMHRRHNRDTFRCMRGSSQSLGLRRPWCGGSSRGARRGAALREEGTERESAAAAPHAGERILLPRTLLRAELIVLVVLPAPPNSERTVRRALCIAQEHLSSTAQPVGTDRRSFSSARVSYASATTLKTSALPPLSDRAASG